MGDQAGTLWHSIGGALRRLGGVGVIVWLAGFAAPAMAMVDVDSTSVDGVPVWYAKDRAVPVVHLILTFEEAGVASDPAALSGRATLAARLLKEGAGSYDSFGFHKALAAKAIKLSVRAGSDDLVVELHTLKEELPEAVRLATLALTEPHNADEAMQSAKQEQLVALKATRESPATMARLAWGEAMFGNHPYAKSGIGDEASIAALTKADLDSYRSRYITRANLQVAAAGDVSSSELKDALEPLVEALPEAFFPERDMPGVVLDGKGEIKRIAHNVPQSVVAFGGAGISRKDKKFYAAYLMNNALGGGAMSSRLMKEVRVKKGLVYSIATGLNNGDGADAFFGQFATRNEAVDEAIATVKQALQDVAQKGFSKRECADVKREVVQGFTLTLDSTQGIANVIATMMRYDLGKDYLEKRAKLFEDVRCKDMQAAAQELLTPDKWLFVVVGGDAAPAPQAAAPVEAPGVHEEGADALER